MRKIVIIFICSIISFYFSSIYAENSKIFSLAPIEVKENLISPTKQQGDVMFTGNSVKKNSFIFSGTGSANSVYQAISILPDINIDLDDPYGLSDKRMRIRGTSDYFAGLTIDGIPNYGIMPIGPRDYIYDTENFQEIKVYSGAVPSDLMSGSGNRGGAIEIKIKEPSDKTGIYFKQSLGSFSYSKTFLRFDSGNFSKLFPKFYLSGSYTDADKWKGDGKLGPRKNFNIGFSKKFNKLLSTKFFINYNSINRNLFKGLNYFQAKDLNNYFYHDYNSYITGNPLKDYDYFNYNRFSAINRDYFAFINLNFSKKLKFTLKPYYSLEDNSKYEGMRFGNFAMVLNKINNSKRYGIIAESNYKRKNFNFTIGYWQEYTDFKPIIKKFGLSSKGLIFKGFGWYTKSNSDGKVLSPYLKFGINLSDFKFQLGGKYFYYKEPAKKGFWYKNGNLIYDKNISITKKTYDKFLPSFSVEFPAIKNINISFSYSKKYQRPYAYGPLSSFYFKNYKKFISSGITLQNLFNGLDMETVDAYDVVIRNNFKNALFSLDLFYQKHKNILVSLENPIVNLSYQQNDGKAKSYGFEVNSEYFIDNSLSLFANFSYNRMKFTKNVIRGGKIFELKGKQFPDTPKYMFKTGIFYNFNHFQISPFFKYISKRYGDALHKESIGGYSLVNLNINYKLKKFKIGIGFNNLFNRKHIGRIDTWDDASGNTTYYAASPFSTVFNISYAF